MRIARLVALVATSAAVVSCGSSGGDAEAATTTAPAATTTTSTSAVEPVDYTAVLPDPSLVPASYVSADLRGLDLQVVVEAVLGTSPYFTSEPEGCLATGPFSTETSDLVVGTSARNAETGANLSILVGPNGGGLQAVAERMSGCAAAALTIDIPDEVQVTGVTSIELPAPPDVRADEVLALRSSTTVDGAAAGGSLVYLATVGDTAIMVNGVGTQTPFDDVELLRTLLADAVSRVPTS